MVCGNPTMTARVKLRRLQSEFAEVRVRADEEIATLRARVEQLERTPPPPSEPVE